MRSSEADGFAEQQDGAASGVEFCVEDEEAVDGAGGPVGCLGAGAFQREAVVFDAAQRGGQVGYQLLRPDDPDRAGGAAGVGGQLASGARGGHERAGFGDRVDAAHNNVRDGAQPPDVVGSGDAVHGQGLINLAYRLLGSLAEAEDAVQETYARWYALSRQQQQAIENPGAWLTTVASRICLNLLGSARVRRERYVGESIPEPLPERTEWITGRPSGTTTDPANRVTLDESVSMAFLVVLESLTPAEHVALILHDVFGYPFTEVAEVTGRTPTTCRQLASSARRRVLASQAPAGPAARQAGVVRAFKQAWEAKDIDALIGLLDPDATAIADGGGLATTFLRPIEGGEQIARAWVEIANRTPSNMTFLERAVNGQPGLVAERRRHRDRVRVRRRRRPDQAYLGSAQPRETPALDEWLTRVSIPSVR